MDTFAVSVPLEKPIMRAMSLRVLLACTSLLLLTSLQACGHSDARVKPDRPPLANPQLVVDNLNGYTVRDDYRYLEDLAQAEDFITSQNAFTENYFDKLSYPNLDQRVTEIFNIGYLSAPKTVGGKLFYLKREGQDVEQGVLTVRENDTERPLVDPNKLDAEGKTTIDWFHPSPDGSMVAYGLSKDGDENSTTYIVKTQDATVLADAIAETRHNSICWLADHSGFYYTRYPKGDQYNRKAYFHQLGDAPEKDVLVFGDKRDKSHWTELAMSKDERYLFVLEYEGHANTDVYVLDRQSGELKPLLMQLKSVVFGLEMKDDTLYMMTNLKAPKGRVVRFRLDNPAPEAWETIIPEGEGVMESLTLVGDTLIVTQLKNVAAAISLHDLTGKQRSEVPLPAPGMISGAYGDDKTGTFAFTFMSFFYPSSMYTLNVAEPSKPPVMVAEVKSDIQPERFEVHQVSYPSYDGTRVNMFLVHQKGVKLDGTNPTLLYGYGGFNVSMNPYFSRRVLSWIDRGGVYAVANIRGGGEYGEAWHEAGTREKKFQVFFDFEYAMRYLIREGYTTPAHLAIEGGSNGGLLVGAMMTRVPHLFHVGLSSVGLYDMVRYHKFPPAQLWIPEYGNADKATDTGFLLGYSPYHQVLKGVKYPALFADTAMKDTRVHWLHTAKFIAALQAATSGDAPILFYLERRAGHGMGKGKSDVTKEYINKFKFMMQQIGDPSQAR